MVSSLVVFFSVIDANNAQANSGLGLELVSQLLADQHKHVLLGSRSVEKGQAALKEVQSSNKPGSVELLEIDVTSESSIAAAVKTVESKHGRYVERQLDTVISICSCDSVTEPFTDLTRS